LSYSAVYKDIGLKEYKEAWDFQEGIFKTLVDNKKKEASFEESVKSLEPGTLIIVEHPHVYTLGKGG
jgi:lipoyl(octanoyl) transferase